MATKSTAKKVIKKSPVKKKSTKAKSSVKKTTKNVAMRSFRLSRDPVPFTTAVISRQTIYWLILVLVIFIAMLWILDLQIQISNLTNQIILGS